MTPKMKLCAIALLGTTALGVAALPIDDFLKMGVSGGCLTLCFWMIAKTLPSIVKTFAESLEKITRDLRTLHIETVKDLRETHTSSTDRLCDQMERVESAIAESSKEQLSVLRQFVTQGHK